LNAVTKPHPQVRLAEAVRSARGLSHRSLLEHAFALAFRGLVYPQIWEDPEIDMEAMAITPDCRVLTITSGGCNVMSYLAADPKEIVAVDLNTAHVALNRLKLAAIRYLPSWSAFYRFFGEAGENANVEAYWRYLAPRLDGDSRRYWEGRGLSGLGRRRIAMFARDFYRHGLLGNFIGLCHLVARLYGVDPRDALRARSLREQREFFSRSLAPLFEKRLIRWVTAQPLSLYGLGIPPAQHAALAGGNGMADVLRERLERLACGFSLQENYFAWQAFGRAYAGTEAGPLPPYLRREHFAAIRARAGRVEVHNAALTGYLRGQPARSFDRYVLLDAQDWMTREKMNALWREITRTAKPGARVIFRTAAPPSPLPGCVEAVTLDGWRYEREASLAYTARDRSAIYGGFHLYVLKP